MPVILHPPVPFMDIATPPLHIHALYLCELLYASTQCIYIYIYVSAHIYIRIMSTRPGCPYYYPKVCREFQSVMFQLRSLSFILELFMSLLDQEIGKFIWYETDLI